MYRFSFHEGHNEDFLEWVNNRPEFHALLGKRTEVGLLENPQKSSIRCTNTNPRFIQVHDQLKCQTTGNLLKTFSGICGHKFKASVFCAGTILLLSEVLEILRNRRIMKCMLLNNTIDFNSAIRMHG